MVVTLIGYRGSGKSSVAAPLASRLGWKWIDADDEIERRAGRSIREIFETDGEPAFRRLEREVLADLLHEEQLVIAAGGGAVLNADTRRDLQAAGPVIWLQASCERLASRINADQSTAERRPNLTTAGGGRTEIEQLLAQREPLYRECASVTIQTDGKSVTEVATLALQAVEPLVPRGS